MHWILQDNLFNEEAYQVLLQTLKRFGASHSIHKVVPFVGELFPAYTGETKNVLPMGSYSLRHISKKEGWNPGVFDLEPFDFTVQKKHWGMKMLNYDSVVSEFKDVVFTEDEMFIRPIHDTKVFSGTVMSRTYFEEWKVRVCDLEKDDGSSLRGDTLVQVSRIKDIYAEYRFWFVGSSCVTYSMYKRGNKVIYLPNVDNRIQRFAKTLVNYDWHPGRDSHLGGTFCLDIADTPYGIKVIEINTLNSSGFYAADIQKLVTALEKKYRNAVL